MHKKEYAIIIDYVLHVRSAYGLQRTAERNGGDMSFAVLRTHYAVQ